MVADGLELGERRTAHLLGRAALDNRALDVDVRDVEAREIVIRGAADRQFEVEDAEVDRHLRDGLAVGDQVQCAAVDARLLPLLRVEEDPVLLIAPELVKRGDRLQRLRVLERNAAVPPGAQVLGVGDVDVTAPLRIVETVEVARPQLVHLDERVIVDQQVRRQHAMAEVGEVAEPRPARPIPALHQPDVDILAGNLLPAADEVAHLDREALHGLTGHDDERTGLELVLRRHDVERTGEVGFGRNHVRHQPHLAHRIGRVERKRVRLHGLRIVGKLLL